jgi:hypothetical protein
MSPQAINPITAIRLPWRKPDESDPDSRTATKKRDYFASQTRGLGGGSRGGSKILALISKTGSEYTAENSGLFAAVREDGRGRAH